MRLDIFNETLTPQSLPWNDALSSWQGRAGSGEIARFIDSPSPLAVCELPNHASKARLDLLQTLQSYGLPVVEPMALVRDRHTDEDLLVIAWNQDVLTLRDALKGSQGIERAEIETAIAQLLVQKVETVEFLPVDDLDATDRSGNGFGSSG